MNFENIGCQIHTSRSFHEEMIGRYLSSSRAKTCFAEPKKQATFTHFKGPKSLKPRFLPCLLVVSIMQWIFTACLHEILRLSLGTHLWKDMTNKQWGNTCWSCDFVHKRHREISKNFSFLHKILRKVLSTSCAHS